jgi:hypothetical protein
MTDGRYRAGRGVSEPGAGRTERLAGEVVHATVLWFSAVVGFKILVLKIAAGFVVVAIVNGLLAYTLFDRGPDGKYDGGWLTVSIFGAYGVWALLVVLATLGRGIRNLTSR